MKILGLKSLIRIKKYKSYKGEQGKIAPNILQRNFNAVNPNEKWATDVTEFNVSGNRLYLSPIIDLFNGEIMSYELSQRPSFNQIISASMSRKGNCLDNAIIENFFGILKSELFYLKKYTSIEQLKMEIKEYINYYNNDRSKSNLNKMSPIQYRAHYYQN